MKNLQYSFNPKLVSSFVIFSDSPLIILLTSSLICANIDCEIVIYFELNDNILQKILIILSES